MTDNIDVGQLSEAINDKMDRDANNAEDALKADYVIDYQAPTAENNYTWYRLYRSGWVEQGVIKVGFATSVYTFNFPITMADTMYEVMTTVRDSLNTTAMSAKYNNETTTSVEVRCSYQSSQIEGNIRVTGMSAQGGNQ